MRKYKNTFTVRHKLALMSLDILVFLSVLVQIYTFIKGPNRWDSFYNLNISLMTVFLISFLYLLGTYEPKTTFSERANIISVIANTALSIMATLLSALFTNYLFFNLKPGYLERKIFLGTFLVFFILASAYRAILWGSLRAYKNKKRTLFVVTQEFKSLIEHDLKSQKWKGIYCVLSSDASIEEFEKVLSSNWNSIVLGTDLNHFKDKVFQHLIKARFQGQHITDLISFYEGAWKKVPIYFLGPEWFVFSDGFTLLSSATLVRLKRFSDLCGAILGLIMFAPLMVLAAIAIKIDSAGPIFYRQKRTGKDNINFSIIKFRSMIHNAEKNGAQWAERNDSRVSRVGKFIRAFRIDETPQFINVLRGEMSFIGPRPERPEFNLKLEEAVPHYALRHLVRPGITGWAQILYPYGSSISDTKQKLEYDLYYIRHYSPVLDFKIIIDTIGVVMGRHGWQ